VVKTHEAGAFVLTAYLTDRIKKGVPLWPETKSEFTVVSRRPRRPTVRSSAQ
jgi:hypothetical protein